MIKKIIVPIIFALVGTSFVTYSFLDTFIIPKNVSDYSVDMDDIDIPLTPFIPPTISKNSSSKKDSSSTSTTSSSAGSSSSSPSLSNSSSSSSSSGSSGVENPPEQQNGYYEDKTLDEILALYTPTKVFEERKHYSDSDVYIDITTHRDAADTTTYYVADIRIKNLGYYRTALAKDKFGQNAATERTSDICNRKKGILAINGDTYGSHPDGYVIRNGNLKEGQYRSTKRLEKRTNTNKAEDLIIKKDGTFEIIDENVTSFEEVVAKNPLHVFSFGPALVNKNVVTAQENEEVGTALSGNKNQRCAIGIISPGHYCFVVSDGRTKESYGLSLLSLAKIMQDLHCETAYNLDGGGSATMYLEDGTGNATGLGHLVNYPHQNTSGSLPSNPRMQQREVSDIVYIGKEQ